MAVDPGPPPADAPTSGEAGGQVWRRNRPASLTPFSGWFTDEEDLLRVNPLASFPFVAAEWEGLLAQPELAFLYAEADGVPVAHFCIRANGACAHLGYLVTDPALRGTGLARPLIRLTAAAARALMPWAQDMTLNVRYGNQRAERLYRGLGFARIGHEADGMFQMCRPLAAEPPWGPPAL